MTAMRTWDEVWPTLRQIARNAGIASTAAAMAAKLTAHLPARPDFETNAEDVLAEAEEQLRVALAAVKAAREQYEGKPVENLPIMLAAE